MKFTRHPSRRELYALGEPFGSSATQQRLDGKRVYGGGGGGGSQTATSYTSNVPEYAKGEFMNLVGKANALTNTPYQPYTGDRIAQFTPLQQQAFDSAATLGPSAATQQGANLAGLAGLKGMTANYQGGNFSLAGGPMQVQGPGGGGGVGGPGGYERVTAPGQNVLQNVQGPGGPQMTNTQSFTQQGTAQNYMNPYTQNVVDIQKREAIRSDDVARQGRNAMFTKAGAFGGSRQGIMEAEAARNLQTQLGDIQAQGLNQAYQQAQQQFNTEQGLGLQSQTANQRAGLDTSQMGLQAALANQRGALDLSQQQLAAQQANQRAGLDTNQMAMQGQIASMQNAAQYAQMGQQAQMANQRAGLDFNNQFLDAQRAREQSRQFGANYGMEGTRTGLQAAQTLGQLGDTQFNQAQSAIGMQYGMGNQQRQAVQSHLDQQYGDFQAQRDYPYQQIGFMSDLLRGAGGSTRQVYPGPSGLQTIAGLGTAAMGLRSMGGGGMKKGGKVKAGLADIAPDMGAYADGGVVGYFGGGTTYAMGHAAGEIARNAKALPWGRGAMALGTAATAAGLLSGDEPYKSKPMKDYTPEERWLYAQKLGASGDIPGSTRKPDGSVMTVREEWLQGAKPPAAQAGQEVVVPDQSARSAEAAGGGSAGLSALLAKAPQVDAGPKPKTREEIAAMHNQGFDAEAEKKAGLAQLDEISKARADAAQGNIDAFEKERASRGVLGEDREKRAKEGLAALDERKGRVKGEALLQAGLAILAADPRRGGIGAIGEGLGIGLKQYRGDIRELAAEKDRLDDKLSQISDLRRQEAVADGKEARQLKRELSTATVQAKADTHTYLSKFTDIKARQSGQIVDAVLRGEDAHADRNLRASSTNAEIRSRVETAALYGNARGGRGGTGQVLKPGTPAYENAVRQQTALLLKQGITGPDGKILMGNDASKYARYLAERDVQRGMTAELESYDTAGPGATQGWDITRPK